MNPQLLDQALIYLIGMSALSAYFIIGGLVMLAYRSKTRARSARRMALVRSGSL